MKARDYRRQVEETLLQEAANALEGMPVPSVTPGQMTEAALEQLVNAETDAEGRLDALQLLKAASFEVTAFAPFAADFTRALQNIAVDKAADAALRRNALETLVAEHDDVARGVLEQSLRNPVEGGIPPAVALGFLARDDHGSAVTLAEGVLGTSTDSAVRAQAVRILGTAPGSVETLRTLLQNKDETREVRRASAVALRALAPETFEAEARVILDDESDFSDIRSTLEGVLRRQRNDK